MSSSGSYKIFVNIRSKWLPTAIRRDTRANVLAFAETRRAAVARKAKSGLVLVVTGNDVPVMAWTLTKGRWSEHWPTEVGSLR